MVYERQKIATKRLNLLIFYFAFFNLKYLSNEKKNTSGNFYDNFANSLYP